MKTYAYYKKIFQNTPKPFAFVDLDLFDENIRQITQRTRKKIRIASKSVRCVELLQRILSKNDQYQGIMAFHGDEAVFLSQKGFDDILVAYPIWEKMVIENVIKEVKKGKKIVLMVDTEAHLNHLQKLAQTHQIQLPICFDLDMSSNFKVVYFGVYRSSIKTVEDLKNRVEGLKKCPNLKLVGAMGYEAQIAGVGDKNPTEKLKSSLIRVLKKRSVKELSKRRDKMIQLLQNEGFTLDFVNAGGTGSLETSSQENWVTEVTVGSGFYASGLFDNYSNFRHLPAAAFAIEITRQPQKNMFTCAGGGYIASGTPGNDKLPKPYLPDGINLIENEGLGEVQTPFVFKGKEDLQMGDPVFFRHSKAGELCERFNELYLIQNGEITHSTETYRGEGKCFL